MSSLVAYCQRLKELGNQIADLGSPMNEQRLVLQLVYGLPREFDAAGALINQQIPSWEDACDQLQSEYERQHAADSDSTVIAAAISDDQTNRRPARNDSHRVNHGTNRRGGGNSHRHNPPTQSAPSPGGYRQSFSPR